MIVSSVARSASTTSAGTSSRRRYFGPGEGDVNGDVVRQLVAATGHLDQHAVDAAATLHVLVVADHVAAGGLEPDHLAELDLLLEQDLELLELGGALGHGVGALGGDEVDAAPRPRP